MECQNVRIRCVVAPRVSEELAARVRDELRAARLELAPEVGHYVPALLLFAQVDADVVRLARETSSNGRDRLLALAVPGRRLGSEEAWRLIDAGASDAFAWDECGAVGAAIAARCEHWTLVDRLAEAPIVREALVGTSTEWLALRRKAVEAALYSDAPLLITGETGTGKELVARLVHSLDPARSQRELVVVDCTTLTPELSGSELFGHERGAYTGAVTGRDGAFALADGGTVFLDEVGELPLMLQAQLLRAVQEGTYKRVGGNDWRRVDFRLLCATNRDLLHDVERGTFRRDLYYRIAGCVVHTPPLRERREDVLPLVRHFLREHCGETAPVLSPAVQAYLLEREFPGNVRDLGQLVGRIAQRHAGVGPITLGDIPPEDRPLVPSGRHRAGLGLDAWIAEALASGMGLREIRRQVEKLVLRAAEGGSSTLREAAAKLGLSERALQMRRASARDDAPVACGPEPLDA